MGAFQPNRRRDQRPAAQPTSPPISAETPSQTRIQSIPFAPHALTSSTPATLRKNPTPLLVSRTTPRPILRSAPLSLTPQHSLANTAPNHLTPGNFPAISRSPHAVKAIHEFDKLINYLLEHRPQVAEAFANKCWELYKDKYSSKHKKNVDSVLSLSTPLQRQRRTDDPQAVIVPDCAAEPPPSLPRETHSVIPPAQTHAAGQLADSLSSDPAPVVRPRKTSRNWDVPLLARQCRLEKHVYERWRTFMSGEGRVTDHVPQDDQKYVVWDPPNARGDPIVLDAKSCCMALLDAKSKLSDVHLKALTFLWCNLIEDTCTGAIFNHGIGYPRTHIIYLFAQLVITSPNRAKNRVLIVCPPSSASQWEMSGDSFENIHINFLSMSQWQENINQWRARGGVLIATDDTYYNILTQRASPDRRAALAALCSPGPDIIILDEASRTNSQPVKPLFRRLLNRTRTRSRLALTSLPLAGFITRAWSIADWACPRLFGTSSEYQCNFVDPIVQGHRQKATLDDAKTAFTKACLLYNKMGMVSFAVDSTMRKEALLSKGLTLHESVIWVNLSREEYALYRNVEIFLNKTIRSGQLSPFIATVLLISAASSVHALRRTLHTWVEAKPEYLESIGHLGTFGRHQETLLDLLRMVEVRLPEELVCTKMQLTLYIGRECLDRKERLVIFASSQELFEDAHSFLRSRLEDTKVHTYDAASPVKLRSESLARFNTAQDGAILFAPYGPTFHCMEESGWGFVNATRVLFFDSSWHSGACVQAVNRVHNFAQLNSSAHVHHLLAKDTVELALSSVSDWRYKHMSKCDSSTLPTAMTSDLDERGFLLAPEVPSGWIRESPPEKPSRTGLPTITRMDVRQHDNSSSSEEHEDIILPLQEMQNISNGDKCVHEIVLNSDRYRSLTENLDLWMRSEWSRKTRFLSEPEDEVERSETIQTYRDSLYTLGGDMLHEVKSRGDGGGWLARHGVFLENASDVCHLLSSWEPYRRLYERMVAITDLPLLKEKRGEKRSRPQPEERDDCPSRQRCRED